MRKEKMYEKQIIDMDDDANRFYSNGYRRQFCSVCRR